MPWVRAHYRRPPGKKYAGGAGGGAGLLLLGILYLIGKCGASDSKPATSPTTASIASTPAHIKLEAHAISGPAILGHSRSTVHRKLGTPESSSDESEQWLRDGVQLNVVYEGRRAVRFEISIINQSAFGAASDNRESITKWLSLDDADLKTAWEDAPLRNLVCLGLQGHCPMELKAAENRPHKRAPPRRDRQTDTAVGTASSAAPSSDAVLDPYEAPTAEQSEP